jgi:hypothetical protein
MLKLKEEVDFKELIKYGFEEDPTNCENIEDHYYFLNNYYYQDDQFRVVVGMLNRNIEILCLPKELELLQTSMLEPLYNLIKDNLVYIK